MSAPSTNPNVQPVTVPASSFWFVETVANGFMVKNNEGAMHGYSSRGDTFVFHTPDQVGEFFKTELRSPTNGGPK